jgi:hypothetical protein
MGEEGERRACREREGGRREGTSRREEEAKIFYLSESGHDDTLDDTRKSKITVHNGRTLPSQNLRQLVGEEENIQKRLEQGSIKFGDLRGKALDVGSHSLIAVEKIRFTKNVTGHLRVLDFVVSEIRSLVEVGSVQILHVDVLAQASASVESDEASVVLQVAVPGKYDSQGWGNVRVDVSGGDGNQPKVQNAVYHFVPLSSYQPLCVTTKHLSNDDGQGSTNYET